MFGVWCLGGGGGGGGGFLIEEKKEIREEIGKRRISRGGKIGPIRWASPVGPELGPGWAIKLLARKKSGQIWSGPIRPGPIWPGSARSTRIFFVFKKLFGLISPIFRTG